mmetsp:Transcript_124735/g.226925  ORF Transcript_124735/g.226925 Transcript_124735/m.226925 type:complete len:211 (+) Transcript_124735:76-708(+)
MELGYFDAKVSKLLSVLSKLSLQSCNFLHVCLQLPLLCVYVNFDINIHFAALALKHAAQILNFAINTSKPCTYLFSAGSSTLTELLLLLQLQAGTGQASARLVQHGAHLLSLHALLTPPILIELTVSALQVCNHLLLALLRSSEARHIPSRLLQFSCDALCLQTAITRSCVQRHSLLVAVFQSLCQLPVDLIELAFVLITCCLQMSNLLQ